MEEFSGQESRQICEALMTGRHSVEWPEECRNCGWSYSEKMKKEVVGEMLGEPAVDYLSVVSRVFKATILEGMQVRYCCINNFRPLIKRKFIAEKDPDYDQGRRYRVFSETLVIEEGMSEWLDVSWSIDETEILEEVRQEILPPSNAFKIENQQPSLFHMLEKLSV